MTPLGEIKAHFKQQDLVIYSIMAKMPLTPLVSPRSSRRFFSQLCREIIGQQLAGKAAKAIHARFVALFPHAKVTPQAVLTFNDAKYREIGTSWAKARYLLDLADKTLKQEVNLGQLHHWDNKQVVAELIKVKGIGQWTAEMFLIFTLGRENVFSHGDLGLNKALRILYNFKDKPTIKQVEKIVSKWAPYRSYGSLALWHSLDNR